MGDKVINTLTVLLIKSEYVCNNFAGVIEVLNASIDALKDYFMDIIKDGVPDEAELAEILSLQQKMIEKYDEYLPEDLLNAGYGRKAFDSKATKEWVTGLLT